MEQILGLLVIESLVVIRVAVPFFTKYGQRLGTRY
jgi:hypothetical protein